LADIADAIVEATRAPVPQVAEAGKFSMTGQDANDPASWEARMEARWAQMLGIAADDVAAGCNQ